MPHRLLLADDSVTVQRVIELTFAEEGVEVVSVGDGQQAILRLQTERFDIVLADVGMPGASGYDVASFVKSRPDLAGLPVVLLTGAFDAVDEARVASVGAAATMAKPFEPQMVIAKVRELLAHAPSPRVHAPSREAPPAPGPPAQPAVTPAAASTPAAEVRGKSASDDYFDRLDRAFATLNPSLEPRETGRPAKAEPPAVESPTGPPSPATAQCEPPADPPASAPTAGLADTFATLLAVEQGELPASALHPRRAGDDELVDRIARRVVEQLGDRAVRDLAADIVSRTAERLVREEIERIKTAGG